MEWFDVKEKSAGKKRLMISWYLYKILGTKVLLVIAFFVSLITIFANRDLRFYSGRYFEVLYKYTKNKKYKPSVFNNFRHVYSYAESLICKMEAYAGTFKNSMIKYTDSEAEEKLSGQIINKEGVIFLCNHVGNVEVLRSFLTKDEYASEVTVSILLQKDHCAIFNSFINQIEAKSQSIKLYPIEEIDVTTISQLDDDLRAGGIILIAGDRIASKNPEKHVEAEFLNEKIFIPQGAFKLVQLLKAHTYFISCVKKGKYYNIYLEEQDELNESLYGKYAKFLEKVTLDAPYQFFNFYDIFKH